MSLTSPATDSIPESVADAQDHCFHCGLPVPAGLDLTVNIQGVERPMCCHGCQAVARAIVDAGHSDFYRHRTAPSPTGKALVPEFIQQTEVYDHPEIQQTFVRDTGAHEHEAALILEGISCAACVWLNERHLGRLPGVLEVQVNYTTHRARVRWDDTRIKLSEILQAIHNIGYTAHPYDPARQQQARERERRTQLRRIGIAGVLGMQVMMLSAALYVGGWSGMEEQFTRLFRWVALLLATPVLAYSGLPFLVGAWRDLRNRSIGMDVPVTLGILFAFGGSVHATLTGRGEVYYDSVVMFIFFLLVSRYFELMARKRGAETAEGLAQALPAMATRLLDDAGRQEIIPAAELQPGDRLLIKAGETVPADGSIESGTSGVSEAMLSGESTPLRKGPGDALIGGSINMESPLCMRVEKTGLDTVLAEITRLLERAQQEKPAITQLADRAAAGFVAVVLLLAGVVGLYWWQHDPDNWLPVLVSVLVVTCPCALSLATPTAISAATGTLLANGLLATGSARIETLAKATHIVFDKTGTLTRGLPVIVDIERHSSLDEQTLLHIAAALESSSEHAAAKAINARVSDNPFTATDIVNHPGAGISGMVKDRTWYIGNPEFVHTHCTAAALPEPAFETGATRILLADNDQVHARLSLQDAPRPEARSVIDALRRAGKQVMLMSGDNASAVRAVANQVGIDTVYADMKPADKLLAVQTLQQQGKVVVMVGDGINDAPVLGAADVSVAMQAAAQISQAGADMILLSNRLDALSGGVQLAQRTMRVIRQNLAWAIGYNLIALPAAALGFVAPWMAAIGMSSSSLLVVLNAMRLTRKR